MWWFRLTFNKNPPIHYLNKLELLQKTFLVNCWPSGKYVHILYMYSILGRGSFCFNYCINPAWHGGDQFVALLRWYGSPGFFDSSLQLICIVGSGVSLKLTFIWKEDFGPLSNSPVLFLHSPGKTLLTLSLVQKWLGSPFPEDVRAWWLLMHWLQLQSTPCEALTSVWISFAWQYSQACSHPCCLCTFSYPNSSFQSTLHLICFDTALCKQPHLSVMTLCDLPSVWKASMFVFWIIAKSAVFSIIVVSKNKRYPECIL